VAENFLRWNLPANSKDIEARAQAVGIASTTLWRARRRLGVVVKDAVWRLPGESAPEVSALPRPEPPAPHDPRLCVGKTAVGVESAGGPRQIRRIPDVPLAARPVFCRNPVTRLDEVFAIQLENLYRGLATRSPRADLARFDEFQMFLWPLARSVVARVDQHWPLDAADLRHAR
jgi:hypothetical protein